MRGDLSLITYVSSAASHRSALRLGMKQYSPPRLTTKAGSKAGMYAQAARPTDLAPTQAEDAVSDLERNDTTR